MNFRYQFRAGDFVEVRSKEEILATLDPTGCLEGMPFMPEMLQFCGKRFRVNSVAHKTCETAQRTWKGRRLKATVHLSEVCCDGSAHGGCQANCNLFWKDAWLKSCEEGSRKGSPRNLGSGQCTELQLFQSTQRTLGGDGDHREYSCQATRILDATTPLAWWDIRQYIRDVTTRNHSLGRVLRVIWLSWLKFAYDRTPTAYRLTRWLRESQHRRLTGREIPDFAGLIKQGQPTPTGRLGLSVGDRVRIKTKEQIARTLDGTGCNRGLRFDVEMSPYCSRTATVRASVTQIVDELTGKMRFMKQPCIILQDVVCHAEYSECRLLCPRQIPSYWREIWLERIEGEKGGVEE